MSQKVTIENEEGVRKEGEVERTWIEPARRLRFVLVRVPLDMDDPDDIAELDDAIESHEGDEGVEEAPAPTRRVPLSTPQPSRSARSS